MAVAKDLLVWHFYCNPVIYQAILTNLRIIIILPNHCFPAKNINDEQITFGELVR